MLLGGHTVAKAPTKDYLKYFKTTQQARLLVLQHEYDAAVDLFYTLFQNHEFVYARDCINAAEVAVLNHNDTAAAYFVARALKQGVPLHFFEEHQKMASLKTTSHWQHVVANEADYYQEYLSNINLEIRDEINAMFLADQALRTRYYKWYNVLWRSFMRKKWEQLNAQQVERMMEITDQYGFPSERLIGIDPPEVHPNISNHQFSAGMPIVLLIHHYSQPNVSHHAVLLEQLRNGYLYNEHFATICDFEVRYGKSKYPVYGTFAFRFYKEATLETIVIERRNSIGLLPSEEMLRLGSSGIITPFWRHLY